MLTHFLPFLSISFYTFSWSLNIPKSEYLALYDLYTSTSGNNWYVQDPISKLPYGNSWNFITDNDPCSQKWQGIECTCKHNISYNSPTEQYTYYYQQQDTTANSSTTCNIEKLFLMSRNLDGTLPRSIGNFSMLKDLHLGVNNLMGTIPTEIGKLSKLEVLSLTRTPLTGKIPTSIGMLTRLKYFQLRSTKIGGSLPSSIGNLQQISKLYIIDNPLSGSIPSSFGNLKSINTLYITWTMLRGCIPNTLGNMKKTLTTLLLSNNCFSGTVPQSIFGLTQLVHIDLSFNMYQNNHNK